MRRAGKSLLALAVLAMALATATAAVAQPSVAGHNNLQRFAGVTPPTTASCLANNGVACYAPFQFREAYELNALYDEGFDGRGRTIAIVDSFGSPTIRNDLHQFDSDFGLPDPKLDIVTPAGAPPPFDPTNSDMVGWAEETTLDVEWAHAIAPGAHILLVETPVSETEGVQGFPEIVKSENFVVDHRLADVITQSFGATEETFPSPRSILDLRSAFKNARSHDVTVLGSSGDEGATDFMLDLENLFQTQVNSWPSSDPLVTSIGGTQLHLDQFGNRTAADNVWNDSDVGIEAAGGGGPSHVFRKPSFQNKVDTGGRFRGTPDISMSAAVNGGALVFTSFGGFRVGYHIFGGTSEASPLFSGVVAIADQIAGRRLGLINDRLYRLGDRKGRSGIVDITAGDNSLTFHDDAGNVLFSVPGFPAVPGYDMSSGLGTVDAHAFAHALAGNKGPH